MKKFLLFIIVIFLVCFSFDLNQVREISHNAPLKYTENQNGVGQFTLAWIDKDGKDYTFIDENDGSKFIANPPKSNSKDITVKYQLLMNMGGSRSAKPGEIKITIPKYMYYGRDNKPVSQEIDIPIAKYPEKGSVGFYYKEEINSNGEEVYVIENFEEIPASYVFESTVIAPRIPFVIILKTFL